MTTALSWLRLELRHRRRSLAMLTLLVALATAAVLAPVAGARRGATAVDRLGQTTLPATVAVLPNQPGFDWAKVRALPQVETLAGFALTGFAVDEVPDYVATFPPVDGELLHTVERPVVLQGRLPDPARHDEVVVGSRFPGAHHRGVGDRLTLRLMSPDQVKTGYNPDSGTPPLGPAVPVTIVGVIRSPWFSERAGEVGGVLPTPALFARHRANFGDDVPVNALVRLHGGQAAIPAFRDGLARVSGRSDIDVWDLEAKSTAPVRQATAFGAASLLAFGLAALAAASVLVGQAVARYIAATTAELRVLRAVGLTRGQTVACASAGPLLAALAGSTLGVAAAAAASVWTPIGAAALREPDPGFDVDPLVLGVGWLLAPILVLAGSAAAAALAPLAERDDGQGRRSAVARTAARWGLPVPVVVGARFALEPGRGRTAVPVRPALLGAVTGVVGVLAAFTFSAGVVDAAEHPARFGQTHQLEIHLGSNGQDFGPSAQILAKTAADPAVRGVNHARIAVAESAGVPVTVFTHDPVGEAPPVVLLRGRMPSAPQEIVLAPSSADALGVTVGDRFPLGGGPTPVPTTVTGIGFVPVGPHNRYVEGAWVTPSGYDRLFAGAHVPYKYRGAQIALRPGADVEEVGRRLQDSAVPPGIEGGLVFVAPAELPEVAQIRDIQRLPVLLGAFLALLAAGALGHALTTAVRRRRREVALLRALGMTRPQSRWTVVVQAALPAIAGLAFGMPIGAALGRTLWRIVTEITPLAYLPPLAEGALLLAGPVTLLLAVVLAVRPGRTAARLPLGQVLRTE
ncbi:FtsX-like permease family protein [Rhizohabitans arisaemae]|uniref:FtsX-like permease family protein n=1 Tax=Rhizohabitans arisaemae TaxID=2720610 RepID=UPI0024B14670|nr:FtsX-like permease family protein [Rhizohabitans arisaemae]